MRQNRWFILFSSQIILICMGSAYAFSVFAQPLATAHNWTLAEVMMAFTINISISPIPMILGGWLSDKGHAKTSIVIGGLIYALAFLWTGHVTSLSMLYFVYGVLAGFGYNIAYSALLSNTLRFFSEKKALAAGIITSGAGIGSMLAAPLCTYLIQNIGLTNMYNLMGSIYIVIIILCSFFIRNAPITTSKVNINNGENKNWFQMLKSPVFYILFSLLAIASIPGLIISSNAVNIGTSMFALTPENAAIYVSLYSISNIVGRLIWGQTSDKIGRIPTLRAILLVNILSFLSILFIPSVIGFAIGLIGLGTSFGGILGVFPAIVMENFGPMYQGTNYGIIFLGYSIAGYIAPMVALMNNGTNDFMLPFTIAIILLILGLALSFIYTYIQRRNSYENITV